MNKKKNIIFICTDQHRVDSLSIYNKETPCQTPHLDKLFSESVVFSNAYTSCPVCTPARSSMHTGLYPPKTGLEANSYETGARSHELMDMPELLSRRLESLGYNLGYTGKWHLGLGRDKTIDPDGQYLLDQQKKGAMESVAYTQLGTLPTDIGFIGDDFPGHGNGGWKYPQFKEYLKKNNLSLDIKTDDLVGLRPGDHSITGEVLSPIESTIEFYLVNRAISIITELLKEDKPFYFNLNFWGPHSPFYAPKEFLDLYRHLKIDPWPSFNQDCSKEPRIYNLIRRQEKSWNFFENALRHYYACISHIDCQIGRLLNFLKEKGIFDDTVIIFSADHGDNQGAHGGLENKSYSMYDETTKIPLSIKPSQKGYSGYIQKAFVGTCDIYATILDMAGFNREKDDYGYGDGRALTPFINHKKIDRWEDEIVSTGMGAFPIVTTQRMYRKGKYKYVFNGAGEDQLFNLEVDPSEVDNLALVPEFSELLRHIKLDFLGWMERHNDMIKDSFAKLNSLGQWQK